jgi:hypothetical protein
MDYAEYLGYLHSTPHEGDMSRAEEMRRNGRQPTYPPVLYQYLVECFHEIGRNLTSGGYPTALTFQEIKAWIEVTGPRVGRWGARLLHEMSVVYISAYYSGSKPGARNPMEKDSPDNVREAVLSMFNFKKKEKKDGGNRTD